MSLAGVDLNLLVALDALLAERNVTRAAERVGLSQPGMSNTLARLRKLFGDPLLVREGLALVPTPRAESLRQPVQEALSLIENALDNRPGFDPARDHMTFTVSCSDYSVLMLIGPLVRRLAAAAPGLTIQVLPRAPDPVRLLRDGDADLVIEPVEIMPETTLPSLRLFADRWVCCVWAGTAEVGDQMTQETYLRLGHLVYSAMRGHPVSIVDTYLAQAKVARRIEFTVESFLLAPFLLQGTDLVAVVPERAAGHLRRTADVRFLEPPMDLPRSPRCCGGTRAAPWTRRTPGSAPASPRSRPNSTRRRSCRLTRPDPNPGQAGKPPGEDRPVDQPRMPGPS